MPEIFRQIARLFGQKNPQYETLTEIVTNVNKIRIWRIAKNLEAATKFNHQNFSKQVQLITDMHPVETWPILLMQIPGVACIAIVNTEGNGVSIYPDWH